MVSSETETKKILRDSQGAKMLCTFAGIVLVILVKFYPTTYATDLKINDKRLVIELHKVTCVRIIIIK